MAYVDNLTTPATGDVAMRSLKTRLVAAGWTVVASGDGRSAYGASSDVITANSGANSLDASGAWMRLRPGSGTRELLIIRGSTSTTWTVRYSAVGFSGGSPSATAAPTATDQQALINAAQLLPTDNTYRWLVLAEDASPWHFWAGAVPTAGGAAQTILGLWPMRSGSYPAADADPYVSIAAYEGTNVATVARIANASTGHQGFVSGTFRRCLFHVAASAAAGGYSFAGGLANTGSLASSGEDLPLEIVCASINSSPPSSYYGLRGYVRDARWCASNTTTSPYGTHLQQGSQYWVRVGDLWLRWGSTPPAL